MASALSAKEHGVNDILIIERNAVLGGVLSQCIHNGFGIERFHKDMTGTEYAREYIEKVEKAGICYLVSTTVLNISPNLVIAAVGQESGYIEIHAKTIILAMGCRERSGGSLLISGERPSGIYSAGTAQRYLNLEGYLVGRKIVILGSGDVGLIMARQFMLEGAKVIAVVERLPYASGSERNIKQCLDDFKIPIYYNTTVISIEGKERVSGVILTHLNEQGTPVPGTEQYIQCDTLIVSAGLIPENELSSSAGVEISPVTGGAIVDDKFHTSVDGIFSCGNVLYVHSLVDQVSAEGEQVGKNAADYLMMGMTRAKKTASVIGGKGIRFVVPQKICLTENDDDIELQFRASGKYLDRYVEVNSGGCLVKRQKFRSISPKEVSRLHVPRQSIHDDLTISVTDDNIQI